MNLEDLIPIGEVVRLLPSKSRPSIATAYRWTRVGIRDRAGERHRLRTVRVGWQVLTTAAWAGEFFQKLAEGDEGDKLAAQAESSTRRPLSRRRPTTAEATRTDAAYLEKIGA